MQTITVEGTWFPPSLAPGIQLHVAQYTYTPFEGNKEELSVNKYRGRNSSPN